MLCECHWYTEAIYALGYLRETKPGWCLTDDFEAYLRGPADAEWTPGSEYYCKILQRLVNSKLLTTIRTRSAHLRMICGLYSAPTTSGLVFVCSHLQQEEESILELRLAIQRVL